MMIERIYFWLRSFKKIKTVDEAIRMELHFRKNLYGDEIVARECRSLWNDKYWNIYECKELKKP